MSKTTRNIVYGAVLAAMAVVLIWLVHFPIFPAFPQFEYDMGDLPLFFGAVLLGPWVGLLVTLAACVVQGLTVSASSGILGIVMHFVATGSFVVCAGLITKRRKTERLIPAFLCGTITQILVMIPLNLIISTFVYFGEPILLNVKFVFKLFTYFPEGGMAVVTGAIAALAFCVAFLITMVYTLDVKHKSEKKRRGKGKVVAWGIIAGIIYAALTLIAANLFLGKIVATTDGLQAVRGMMLPVILPFNAIKAGANAVLAGVLYFILGKRITV